MQALCFFLLSIFSRSFYSLTVQFFQVLRSFSGLPLSLGYSVLSCLTAVAWTTIGLLVMIEACQASRPGAGRGGSLHPRMLLRSARIATFCCFMVSLLFPCFFLVSLSFLPHFAVAVHHHAAAHALLVGDAQRLRCALDGAGAAGATASGRLGSLRRGIQALHDLPPWAALPSAEHLLDLRSALCVHSALGRDVFSCERMQGGACCKASSFPPAAPQLRWWPCLPVSHCRDGQGAHARLLPLISGTVML